MGLEGDDIPFHPGIDAAPVNVDALAPVAANRVAAHNGIDRLYGGAGADTIYGDDGGDLIDGSLDTLSLPFAGGTVDPNKVVAIAPADVEGDTLEAKRGTLDAIAGEIDQARLKADKQPGAAAVRLQRVLDFILGDVADPDDDLIVGGIGAAIRGLVDEAKRALKPGN